MEFFLPRSSLPESKPERRLLLDEYFPQGLIPFETIVEEGWKLNTFVPDNPDYYVDPSIGKVLKNWNRSISFDEMGSYWSIKKNALLSLADSWSLYYWSMLLEWLAISGQVIEEVTVLHVDDHLDQASPLILSKGCKGDFECIFSNELVSMFNPASIEQAIIRKSINIGSFLTPLLHTLKRINILHLKYSHHGDDLEYGLRCTFDEDNVLAKGKLRPSLTCMTMDSEHLYSVSSSPSSLLDKIKGKSFILLHLDCDAFNNRYNGDSNWCNRRSSIDLNLNQIKEKIDELFSSISSLSIQTYMNVALSPGFFPSEFWSSITKYIFEKAEYYGIVKDDDFSDYLRMKHPEVTLNEFFD